MRRITFLIPIAAALGLVLLASPLCAAAAIHDYDPSADFASYRTFRWLSAGPDAAPRAGRSRPGREAAPSPLVDKQIAEAIRAELERKELRFVETGPVDLLVAYHTGKRREVVGYGWGPRYAGPRRVAVYEEGTLTIDLVDRAQRELVWRGYIAASIRDDPEKRHQQLGNLVEKVLAKYPPPGTGGAR